MKMKNALLLALGLWAASLGGGRAAGDAVLATAGGDLVFSTAEGLRWKQIVNRADQSSYLAPEGATPVFYIDEEGTRLSSADFTFVRNQPDAAGRPVLIFENAENGLRAHLSLGQEKDGPALLGLKVENLQTEDRQLQVIFPVLGPVNLGGEVDAVSYFYPWRTGISGSVDCRLSHEYGSLAWMQIVALFDPATRRGLYVFPRDPHGRFKGIQFRKTSGKKGDFVRHNETILPQLEPRSPLTFRTGAGVAFYYLPRPVKARGTLDVPEAEIGIYQGGWKEALQAYGKWTRTWFKKVKTPEWFQHAFTFLPVHPNGYWSKEENRYISSEKITGSEDVVQWAFWEQHEDRTENPSKNVLENMQYGDFEYHEGRGGLKTFAEEIARLREKDVRFTVYIDHRFAWAGSKIGREKGEEWAAMYKPGEYGYYATPDDKWMMPLFGTGRWVDYLASVCHRLVKDTGMDGIYLDELNIAFPDYHPGHTPEYGDDVPVPIPLLAQGVTKIRDAIVSANPQAILMTEHAGSDYMSQFVDGSWMQTFYTEAFPFAGKHFDADSLVYYRFLFPEFKLAQWGDAPDGLNRCFFNGVGSPYFRHLDFYAILKENADAFSTLEPEALVPTSRPDLLANRFPFADKTIFTVYNKSAEVVDEPALIVSARAGHHYVDLRKLKPLTVERSANDAKVSVLLSPGQVTAVAELPELLTVTRDGAKWRISVPGALAGAQVLVGTVGRPETTTHSPGAIEVPAGADHEKLFVKLMKDGLLKDLWVQP